MQELQEWVPFLVVTMPEEEQSPEFGEGVYVAAFHIPPLSRLERRHIWDEMFREFGIEPEFTLNALSNQYNLTAGGIRQAAWQFARSRELQAATDEQVLRNIIEASSRRNLKGKFAKLIKPRFSWDDIVLPSNTMERLAEICNRIKHEDKVLDTWGFGKKYPYGIGLSVLFYGAPGTGKTMAAHVIASELKTLLMHVDFSNMIDKYIGETEKHITELFRQARHMNAVLFFDEADALFAKRSEVSDATDRYANAQTACLLQCIEEYEGVVILATNLLTNFDAAFKRRLRYYIHFNMPDEQHRLRIWKDAFPANAPLDKSVDFLQLAQRELSAGSIKNIVLTSAYLAAEDPKITIQHLNRALRIEMSKEGQLINSTDVFYGWV